MLSRSVCINASLRCFIISSSFSRHAFNRSSLHRFFQFVYSNLSCSQSILTIRLSSIKTSSSYFSCRPFSISSSQLSPVVQFKLTDIGEGIREVEIIEWYVQVGDNVKQFDKICEVQSDKANVTIISRYGGTIVKLHQNANKTAKVGEPLVDIKLEHDLDVLTGTKTATIMPEDTIDNAAYNRNSLANILVTPAIRRLAKELHISLNDVQGTGKDGRILKEDLIRFKTGKMVPSKVSSKIPPPSPTAVKQVSLFRPSLIPNPSTDKKSSNNSLKTSSIHIKETKQEIRKKISRMMYQANSVPNFTYFDEYDMTQLRKLSKYLKHSTDQQQLKHSYMPFIIKACSQALFDYPILNAHVDSKCEILTYKGSHNIGVEIDATNGLIRPNIKNVQQLSIVQIASELHRLQQLAKAEKLSEEDLTNGTFSLSNIGVIGSTYVVPIIRSPEVAVGILGKIFRQAFPNENIENSGQHEEYCSSSIHEIMSVSWSADHRIIDGATMVRFSNKLKFLLENPLHLLIN